MSKGFQNWMLQTEVNALCRWNRAKGQVKEELRALATEEKGATGTIEIVLILVVVIGLAVVFRDNITGIVNKAWASITGQQDKLTTLPTNG